MGRLEWTTLQNGTKNINFGDLTILLTQNRIINCYVANFYFKGNRFGEKRFNLNEANLEIKVLKYLRETSEDILLTLDEFEGIE